MNHLYSIVAERILKNGLILGFSAGVGISIGVSDYDGHPISLWQNIALTLTFFCGTGLAILVGHEHRQSGFLRQLMETLYHQEQRLRATFESLPYAILVVDEHGFIKAINQSALDLFSYSNVNQIIGKTWQALFSPEEGLMLNQKIIPHIKSHKPWTSRVNPIRFDKRLFVGQVTIMRLNDGHITMCFENMTGRELEQQISTQRLAAIEVAADGIGIVDAHGDLIYANEALWTLHRVNFEDRGRYIGESWTNLYTEDGKEQIINDVMPRLKQIGFWRGESPIVTCDGAIISAELSLTRLPDGGMVGTARDITERKQAQHEKELLQKQMFQAQKMEAVGRLAGGIAHDFNNILASIMGYAEFLYEDLPIGTPQQKFADNILQSGVQARRVIDQILSFSRRKESSKAAIDLAEVVEETVTLIQGSFPRTITVNTDIDSRDMNVLGDHAQLSQMLMNLFVNAKDAMDDGHGALDIHLSILQEHDIPAVLAQGNSLPRMDETPLVRVEDLGSSRTRLLFSTLSSNNPYVHLIVSDTGSGIPRAVMEHMFEPFFSTKDADKGTGLGMSTVHGILVSHQAAMIVDSIVGRGTRFDLYFPLDQAHSHDHARSLPAIPRGGEGHIVVIDDQIQVLEMEMLMLQRLGYNAVAFQEGLSALDYIREHGDDIDLIVSDQTMPSLTGLELALEMLEDFPFLPLVLISGYNDLDPDNVLRDYPNIKAVLKKPITSTDLAHHIELYRLKRVLSRAAS